MDKIFHNKELKATNASRQTRMEKPAVEGLLFVRCPDLAAQQSDEAQKQEPFIHLLFKIKPNS